MTKPAPKPVLVAAGTALPAEDRGTEILLSIRATFAERGYEGASMQELARAAGISVGNFYRYFPSKMALFEAMVGLSIVEKETAIALAEMAEDPIAALRTGIALHLRQNSSDDDKLWAEINAAAQRTSELGEICSRMEDRIAQSLMRVFAVVTGLSPAATEARFGAHARYIVLAIRAAVCRPNRSDDPKLDDLVLRGIDLALDEVSAFSPAPD